MFEIKPIPNHHRQIVKLFMAVQQRNPIRKLSTSVVNKIAAGEVIERPASVVKELLENAVDSGASVIEVAIEKGGIESIRITDNGCGIEVDQLELAVTSHATSKIVDADDLFKVGTFGFRGEALASIAEISQTRIRSKPADQDSGYELMINGGNREPIQPCGCPDGTSFEIRQLFYNTPVRQKFLKTPQTEKGHITEAFARVALANPQIKMTLLNNQRPVHQLAATDNWQERIAAFFGPEIADNLIAISDSTSVEGGEIRVHGYVVNPAVTRSNNRMQYLFLNNRFIRDRSLQHALSEAYRGLIMVGRFPVCFLRLDMPFEMVDVNVHPGKLEVRFQNGGQIYSQLLGTLRSKFLKTDLTARAQLSKPEVPEYIVKDDPTSPSAGLVAPSIPSTSETQNTISFQQQASVRDWTQAPRQPFPMERSGASSNPLAGSSGSAFPSAVTPSTAGHTAFDHSTSSPGSEIPTAERTDAGATNVPAPTRALQVHNTYLISETEEGMVVIDQHALHERIIYEQLREKVLNEKLESQKLLVPEPVTLPPAETALVLENTELLQKIGIEVEAFGGDTVLVSAYPAMLANHNPAEMLRGVIEHLANEAKKPDQRDLVDELLHMISCKAAIKAGDKLTPEEISALLEHRQLCQDAHHCPHGRPTALVFSREELDKRFKRI
jgi:DNA mismatch repair protein MutL